MEIDDEDPAWLEACMAAVDSLPIANIQETSEMPRIESTSTIAGPSARANSNISSNSNAESGQRFGGSGDSSAASNRDVNVRKGSSVHPSRGPPPRSHVQTQSNDALASSANLDGGSSASSDAKSRAFMRRSTVPTARGFGEDTAACSGSRRREPKSWAKDKPRRIQGVGINPDGDAQCAEDHVELDPCWKCGEAVRDMQFGSNRYYGCSGHPLCKATRTAPKNGAVIELVAEERNHPDDSNSVFPIHDKAEHAGITRCHLRLRIKGGHHGGAAQAAWDMLRRNGILPVGTAGGSSGAGGSTDGGSGSGGTAWTDLKAVLELSKRDAIRRLAKQEGMTYRDVPQTTYSRLMSSGAGEPTHVARRGGKGASHLEPMGACEALIYTLPAGLRKTLLPFQRDGVLYGLRRKGRCLIADEMGTGKTLQALGVMGCYREDWPLLVVAPASMRLMWAEEVEHWYPFLAPGDIHLIKGSKDKLYLTKLSRGIEFTFPSQGVRTGNHTIPIAGWPARALSHRGFPVERRTSC